MQAILSQVQQLRVRFQNIGGFPSQKNSPKDDLIRTGITNWEFDVIGLVETNLDWRLIPEDTKLWARTREWWEHLHISHSHNITFPARNEKQFGGTAVFSINDTAHRVVEKGWDSHLLGRWSWTKLWGKNGHSLIIIAAYRPNPPSAGVKGVYAQHAKYFNSIGRDTCPREAFLTDLSEEIVKLQEAGNHLLLMLDGNEDTKLQLREVILH
jgi:hypothetical protein